MRQNRRDFTCGRFRLAVKPLELIIVHRQSHAATWCRFTATLASESVSAASESVSASVGYVGGALGGSGTDEVVASSAERICSTRSTGLKVG